MICTLNPCEGGAAEPSRGREQGFDVLNAQAVTKLAQVIALAVFDSVAAPSSLGRSSFTVREVAKRAGFSEAFVRTAIATGRLRAVRPGGVDYMRVLPEDERLWLLGKVDPDDQPVVGVSPRLATRNRVKKIVADIGRGDAKRHRGLP